MPVRRFVRGPNSGPIRGLLQRPIGRPIRHPLVADVIVAQGESMSYDELLEAQEKDVTKLLDLLVEHKLTGNIDKATIAVSMVVSVGHVVSNADWKAMLFRCIRSINVTMSKVDHGVSFSYITLLFASGTL